LPLSEVDASLKAACFSGLSRCLISSPTDRSRKRCGLIWSASLSRLRWRGVALAAAVAIGLLGANYHWLSDIIAGAIVGVTTGWATARISGGAKASN
jgi:membrane-associated phospholipid phosphatase